MKKLDENRKEVMTKFDDVIQCLENKIVTLQDN